MSGDHEDDAVHAGPRGAMHAAVVVEGACGGEDHVEGGRTVLRRRLAGDAVPTVGKHVVLHGTGRPVEGHRAAGGDGGGHGIEDVVGHLDGGGGGGGGPPGRRQEERACRRPTT